MRTYVWLGRLIPGRDGLLYACRISMSWGHLMNLVLRIYLSEDRGDITVTNRLLRWLLIGSTEGRLIRLSCSCLFLRVNKAGLNSFHETIYIYTSVSSWFDLWADSSDSSTVTRSSGVIDGEFLRHSVESINDPLVHFAGCYAHRIQCNTMDDPSDWLNRETGPVGRWIIADCFVCVRDGR